MGKRKIQKGQTPRVIMSQQDAADKAYMDGKPSRTEMTNYVGNMVDRLRVVQTQQMQLFEQFLVDQGVIKAGQFAEWLKARMDALEKQQAEQDAKEAEMAKNGGWFRKNTDEAPDSSEAVQNAPASVQNDVQAENGK